MADELYDAYAEVQRRKDDPWEPSREQIDQLATLLRDQLGGPVSTAAVKATVDGIGWTGRMMAEYGLAPTSAMQIPEKIADNTARNLARAEVKLDQEDAINAGVGAGWFTGLYVALLLMERRNDG